MKKRILSFILVLLLAISLFPVAYSAGANHRVTLTGYGSLEFTNNTSARVNIYNTNTSIAANNVQYEYAVYGPDGAADSANNGLTANISLRAGFRCVVSLVNPSDQLEFYFPAEQLNSAMTVK